MTDEIRMECCDLEIVVSSEAPAGICCDSWIGSIRPGQEVDSPSNRAVSPSGSSSSSAAEARRRRISIRFVSNSQEQIN